MSAITVEKDKPSKILAGLLRETSTEGDGVRMWRGHKLNAGSLVRNAPI